MHTASSTGIVWMASSNACIASAPNIPRVLPLPMPSTLKRADPCLLRGGFIEYGSAKSYQDILRFTLTRLERKAPLGDRITNLEDSQHVSLCDR